MSTSHKIIVYIFIIGLLSLMSYAQKTENIVLDNAFYLPSYFGVKGDARKRRFWFIVFVFYAYYNRAAHRVCKSRYGFGELFVIARQHKFIIKQGIFRYILFKKVYDVFKGDLVYRLIKVHNSPVMIV